ncbi:MAG: OmpA family protein [Hyphomicrobiales bacterium]
MRFIRIIALMVFTISIAAYSCSTKALLKAGDEAFSKNQYQTAIAKYKKANSKAKDKEEKDDINYKLAESYRLTNENRRLPSIYKRLIKNEYDKKKPEIRLYYGDALKKQQKYNEALEQYEAYKKLRDEDSRAQYGIESVKQEKEWNNNRSKYTVNRIKDISSKQSDFAPSYYNSTHTEIIFTSTREGGKGKEKDAWTGQNFSDLYTAKKDRKGEWSTPIPLDEDKIINTKANEGSPFLNKKFNKLYFTRCPTKKSQESGCMIMVSQRNGRAYGEPKRVEINGIDTLDVVGHPTLSDDERIMIFSGKLKNNIGINDLYITTRKSKNDKFIRPQNMGPVINTEGKEVYPFLKNDTTLYFSSNGHPGLGGLDIFVTYKREDGSWTIPQNLGAPINSAGDDFGITFNRDSDNDMGFFSSNRDNRRGFEDIYEFVVPPLEFTISGTVKNNRSLQYVEGAEVKLVGSNGAVATTKTNDKGFYTFGKNQVLPNTSYEVLFSKPDFFNAKAVENTIGLEGGKDFTMDQMLMPIPNGTVVLPEILYDLGKWDLKPQYEDSLQGLIMTLDQNPNVKIELAAHTDPRGSTESNDLLSQRRAQSVVDYLVLRGIDPGRMIAKGYGERVPIRLSKDITKDGFLFKKGTVLDEAHINRIKNKEQKELAYEMNRRTEFKVLSRNYSGEGNNSSGVEIITDINTNEVPFTTQEKTGIIIIPININGYTQDFYYEKISSPSVSLDAAKEWLSKGIIGKDNFGENAEKALANGTVANNSTFVVPELTLAGKTIYDVKFTVRYRQKNPITIGQKGLSQFGKFKIDKASKKIIFDK